jgi:rRNA small subunit pseudouridine methyltransferase Nep1
MQVSHTLLIAESEVELIPRELENHPIVLARARRTGKLPGKMILQATDLHKAMREVGLAEAERRGRPDLLHFALTVATDSPAFLEGRLEIVVHLRGDKIIRLAGGTRPPKDFGRFVGLIEQLLSEGRVPPTGEPLMKLEAGTVESFVKSLGKPVIVFDAGEKVTGVSSLSEILSKESHLLVVGGFPHGTFHYKPEGKTVTVSRHELLAGTVIGFISAALGEGTEETVK